MASRVVSYSLVLLACTALVASAANTGGQGGIIRRAGTAGPLPGAAVPTQTDPADLAGAAPGTSAIVDAEVSSNSTPSGSDANAAEAPKQTLVQDKFGETMQLSVEMASSAEAGKGLESVDRFAMDAPKATAAAAAPGSLLEEHEDPDADEGAADADGQDGKSAEDDPKEGKEDEEGQSLEEDEDPDANGAALAEEGEEDEEGADQEGEEDGEESLLQEGEDEEGDDGEEEGDGQESLSEEGEEDEDEPEGEEGDGKADGEGDDENAGANASLVGGSEDPEGDAEGDEDENGESLMEEDEQDGEGEEDDEEDEEGHHGSEGHGEVLLEEGDEGEGAAEDEEGEDEEGEDEEGEEDEEDDAVISGDNESFMESGEGEGDVYTDHEEAADEEKEHEDNEQEYLEGQMVDEFASLPEDGDKVAVKKHNASESNQEDSAEDDPDKVMEAADAASASMINKPAALDNETEDLIVDADNDWNRELKEGEEIEKKQEAKLKLEGKKEAAVSGKGAKAADKNKTA